MPTWLLNWKTFGVLIVGALLVTTHAIAYRAGAASRDAEIARLAAAQAMDKAAYAAAAMTAQQQLDKAAAQTRQAVAAADARAAKEINDAKRRFEADRAAVRAGTLGVRLNGAECVAAGSGAMPGTARATGGADATAGALPATVAENVLDLRASIEHDAAVIRGLQDYARAVTGAASPPASAEGGTAGGRKWQPPVVGGQAQAP